MNLIAVIMLGLAVDFIVSMLTGSHWLGVLAYAVVLGCALAIKWRS